MWRERVGNLSLRKHVNQLLEMLDPTGLADGNRLTLDIPMQLLRDTKTGFLGVAGTRTLWTTVVGGRATLPETAGEWPRT
jgi:hypothetical protein